ncbi:hypothetical protein IQ279_05410 [Streptomyces verrucosisporus]|uniref:hypothetical protein n=1 Tax=Streptomyces verrucosisporus TaxID=1695161 RepID=UPI0019CF7100|nr:hypothetical protein [Streptomyces verrucosisporus]MBN3929081.1 hypothetical protein [Streptomyces verrucosisporus]
MSAISLILLLAAAVAAALGGAALHTALGLRRRLAELRARLAAAEARAALAHAFVPPARTSPDTEEIRSAVADALAEERERELAEARAFWAAQEARDDRAESLLPDGRGAEHEGAGPDPALLDALLERALGSGTHEGEAFVPHQTDREGAASGPDLRRPAAPGSEDFEEAGETGDTAEADSAELAAARRRHPSHPGYGLNGEPVVPGPATEPDDFEDSDTADRGSDRADGATDHESTRLRLAELAECRTPLADVRPGLLGTLDVYVFADGTTVCMTPGHRETAERLAAAVREGAEPVLLGGSGVLGAYALTFACGRESVYVLADRVIASV